MKRFLLAFAALAALLLGPALAAAPTALQHLPIVRAAPAASICDGSAPLLDQDTGSLSAMRDADGHYVVAYQDRAHGSVAHVAQHVGDRLEELSAPPVSIVPAFSPDGVKQGSLALVPSAAPGGRSRLYYTQRKAGDETGPYGIWCMEF